MNEKTQFSVDPEGKWLYRVGGMAAIAFGISYLIIIVLYVPVGLPTSVSDVQPGF